MFTLWAKRQTDRMTDTLTEYSLPNLGALNLFLIYAVSFCIKVKQKAEISEQVFWS